MLFIASGKPCIQNLNSYYLDVERLIEHYQGEIGSGGIHFRSVSVEATVFFDESTILNVIFQDKTAMIDGKAARDRLIKNLETDNFTMAVHPIDPARIFFWANLAKAEPLLPDPAAELNDLQELIRKMSSIKLTGYIEAVFDDSKDSGAVFFNNGSIIGAASSWDRDNRSGSKQNLARLIDLAKNEAATFRVRRIDLSRHQDTADAPADGLQIPPPVLNMIRDLLVIFEKLVDNEDKIRLDFDTLLKKKFIEKADWYDFLDPFAGEFKYSPESAEFTGQASAAQLLKGIRSCVRELAEDLELTDALRQNLGKWARQYAGEISRYGINI